MANHKSAKKRIIRNAKRAEINGARISRIRTFIKKVETAITAGNKDEAQQALRAQHRRHAGAPPRKRHVGFAVVRPARPARSAAPRLALHALCLLVPCFGQDDAGSKWSLSAFRRHLAQDFGEARAAEVLSRCVPHPHTIGQLWWRRRPDRHTDPPRSAVRLVRVRAWRPTVRDLTFVVDLALCG